MSKKIKPKNYAILAVIVIVTILAVFYIRSWYIATKDYYANNSIMLDVTKEINESELNNYVLENPKFILYISSGQNGNIKTFEKQMKKFISEEELENLTLYLNRDNANENTLQEKLISLASNKNIRNKIENNSEVSIYIIENGKITNAIVNAEKASIKQIKPLFKKYGVLDND